jgi:molybdenum cofactor biosynthesis enzyme
MVDVAKDVTHRYARAIGHRDVQDAALVRAGGAAKGDVLGVARSPASRLRGAPAT